MKFNFKSPQNSSIGRYLNNVHAFYEADLLKDSMQYLHENDSVVDIGANIGNHTIFWGKICKCKVCAFEPNEKAVRFLRDNIISNNIDCQIYKYALGSHNTKGKLIEAEDLGETKVEYGAGNVRIKTLDSFKLNPRLIKIDVEGFEIEVLKGALKTIEKCKVLYIETKQELIVDQLLIGFKRTGKYGYTPTYKYLRKTEGEKHEDCVFSQR